MLGALAGAAAGAAAASGSMLGSKLGSVLNGPQKAVLVLHYTPQAPHGTIPVRTSKFQDVVVNTQNALSAAEMNTEFTDKGDYVMEVQYNPSSINITANADSMPIKPLQPSFDASVPLSASVPPSIIMMIELIFDDIVVADAFMADKLNVSAGNVANDAMLLADAAAGRVHSVQPKTNGLLAAMQRTQTRSISLYWADMHFHGEIKDMQARYTLFSVSGRPIRSVVNMTLVQNNVAGDGVINEYWENSFDFIFPPVSSDPLSQDKYSARTIAQNTGALTNINF